MKFIFLGLDCFTSNDQMNSAKLGKLQQTAHQTQTEFFYFSRIKTKPSEPESYTSIFYRIPMTMFMATQVHQFRLSNVYLLHIKCAQCKFTFRRHLPTPPNQPCWIVGRGHNKYPTQVCFIPNILQSQLSSSQQLRCNDRLQTVVEIWIQHNPSKISTGH